MVPTNDTIRSAIAGLVDAYRGRYGKPPREVELPHLSSLTALRLAVEFDGCVTRGRRPGSGDALATVCATVDGVAVRADVCTTYPCPKCARVRGVLATRAA